MGSHEVEMEAATWKAEHDRGGLLAYDARIHPLRISVSLVQSSNINGGGQVVR
jgi:hypothetical protein